MRASHSPWWTNVGIIENEIGIAATHKMMVVELWMVVLVQQQMPVALTLNGQ